MPIQKKDVAVADRPSDSDLSSDAERPKPTLAIIARQQTADEQHRFRTATDALLMELVRQRLGRRG